MCEIVYLDVWRELRHKQQLQMAGKAFAILIDFINYNSDVFEVSLPPNPFRPRRIGQLRLAVYNPTPSESN